MHVRLARGADASAVETIRVRGWQTAYRHILPPAELDALRIDGTRWRARFDSPPTGWTTFAAERDSAVVGFAAVGPSRDEQGLGELYAIYVEPAAWSRGAGRALITRAEEQLAQTYSVATLWVLTANARARRFYEQAGWQLDGAVKAQDRWGVEVEELRYRKNLVRTSASTSRSRSCVRSPGASASGTQRTSSTSFWGRASPMGDIR
jgi:GNAT superfamily N-acetyltransferase